MDTEPENKIVPSGLVTPCTRFPLIAAEGPEKETTVPDHAPVMVGGGGGGAGVELPPQAERTHRQQTSKTHRAFMVAPF